MKVVLFFIMGVVLAASFAAERSMREGFAESADGGTAAVRQLVRLYGTIATLGTVALGLGLWLAGT
jgi:CHASE1-domain containing sensor protein